MPLNRAVRLSSDWLCDSYAEGVVCLPIDESGVAWVQRRVLNPIARITHQAIRASHIAKAPPIIEPVARVNPMSIGSVPNRVITANKAPPATPNIPI